MGEAMLEAELVTGLGKKLGAIGAAAVGEDALDGDAVGGVKGECLTEGLQDAGRLFIGEQAGEAEAGMVVDGDVEGFGAGAGVAVGAVAGGADAGLVEAAKLLDIKMQEFAWRGAFAAHDRRLGWFEGTEAVEAVAAQDTGERGLGDGQDQEDLGVGTALFAEGEDLGFELRGGLAWLMQRNGGAIFEALGEAGFLGALEPLADGLVGDGEGSG